MKLIREINEDISFTSPKMVYNYLKEFKDEDREYFIVIGLDTRHKPIYREVVSIGTLNKTIVHAREVFKKAIMMSCNSIILAHNHPSGDCKPSTEDIEVTNSLRKAGEILGINVLDHIIIGKNDYFSILD